MVGTVTTSVHKPWSASAEAQPADGGSASEDPRYRPGQAVELAVQVGSWKEGTLGQIIEREPEHGSPYEWRVRVYRESPLGPVDASLYEHELRPTASRLEKLCARVSGWDELLLDELKSIDGEAPFEAAVDKLFTEAQDILLRKHSSYGPRNVSRAPGGAINGLRVRMHDKWERLNHIIDNDIVEPEFESLRDTFVDMANYALIAVLVLDGAWPE